MKKIFSILLTILLCITITSCKKEEQLNDELTEISLYELFTAFDSHKKIVFAIVDKSNDDSVSMLEHLGNYQKTYNNHIYYVDTSDLNDLEKEYVEMLLSYTYDELRYYVIDEGEIQSSYSAPQSFKDVKTNLGTVEYQEIDIDDLISNRDKAYKKGLQALEDGYITTSYNYLKEAFPKKEAKEKIKEDNYYILNNWEELIEKGNNCSYFGMYFVNANDQFYISEYNGPCNNFDKKNLKPILYNYMVKDDIIFTRKESAKDNVKYNKMFTIISSDQDNLIIKGNTKEYNLNIVGE